jgi:hypothetical protein
LLQYVLAGVAQKAFWMYLCMLHYVAAALLRLLPAAWVAVAAHVSSFVDTEAMPWRMVHIWFHRTIVMVLLCTVYMQ